MDATSIAAIIAVLTAIGGSIAAGFKWVGARIEKRIALLEKERGERENQLREAHRESQERCQGENAKLVARIQHLEDRSHEESREERLVILNAIASSSSALETNARSFSKLADRLPDPTPSTGVKTVGH